MFMFVNMLFNKEDRTLVNNLYMPKGYVALEFMKESPSKTWNERSLRRLL